MVYLSALHRHPFLKAAMKINRVVLRWALRSAGLSALSVGVIFATWDMTPAPPWALAFVSSAILTVFFMWLGPERRARARLRRLRLRAAELDLRRLREGHAVLINPLDLV